MADDATNTPQTVEEATAGTALGNALLKLSEKERADLNWDLCQLLAKHAGRSFIAVPDNEHYTKAFYLSALVVGQLKK